MQTYDEPATIQSMFGEVQLAALRLAYRNRANPRIDRFGPVGADDVDWRDMDFAFWRIHDVFIWEVLVDVYGWEPSTRELFRDGRRADTAQRFSVAEIGEKEYRARHAAVSRALTLLERRGYMERVRGAGNLTGAGVELCEKLFGHTEGSEQ